MSANVDINDRPAPDQVLVDIAEYVCGMEITSTEAYDTARNCLIDTLGCGLLALRFPECTKHLGPLVEGTVVPHGARVPGTAYRLDPVKAAWDIGCIVRWLDYNDTWLAAEWGHPSDNLGDDPQARALGTFYELEHPTAGRFETVAPPIQIEGTPLGARRPVSALGADGRDVLREAGLDESEIEKLL